jgi:VWFA-related protein
LPVKVAGCKCEEGFGGMKKAIAFLAAVLGCLGPLAAQDPTQPAKAQFAGTPAIRTTSQEVLLDMVFRDKKGRSIHDIRPEEIQILEEGVEQKLNSFRLVEGNTAQVLSANGAGARTAALPLDPMREIRLVTLVFERLGPDDKRFFQQAVKDLLAMAAERNLYFSVMTIDQNLHVVQPFTADHQSLLKTLNRALGWSYVQFQNNSAEVMQQLQQVVSSDQPQIQGTGTSAPSPGQIGASVDWQLAKMQYDMLKSEEAADRAAADRATIFSLLGLVRAEASLPGRKVILYFNPQFRVPEILNDQYKNLKSEANRGNVTFYTVDTKGLVSFSQEQGGRDMLKGAADEVRRASQVGADRKVTVGQVREGENAENSARDNPLLWLVDLAKDTGGSAVVETNDWKAPLKVAMDEVRTYYEATYTPAISVYDGKFRRIAVKIDRPEVQVHTRAGYYALPVLNGGQQLYSYELPLLNAISAAPLPNQVPFRAAASRFNNRGPKVEYMLTVEAPLAGLAFEPHPEQKNATVNAGLLALLRNQNGEIVDKFSKDFAVQVDLDKVEGYKAGNMVQTFQTRLNPGRYTLEVAVMDRQADKVGARKVVLTVPAPTDKLSISDIVVVRRKDALKDSQILDAFYFEGGKIVPTLNDALKGGPGNILPFYFAIYPDKSIQEAPKLTMSFYLEGQLLGAAEAPLPPPQKDGRIPYIAELPADKFLPGNYEIRVGVMEGNARSEEKIAFRVE